MNLQRGLFRLTLVISAAVGICCALLAPKPSLHAFRWRSATQAEVQKAEKWRYSSPKPFDPDMYLINKGRIVLKPHQSALPFEFAAIYFVLPFITGALVTWLLYAVIRFIIKGFRA
jgi:hypothetical protein